MKDTWCYKRPHLCDVNWLTGIYTDRDTAGGIEPESKDIIISQMREQGTDCH